MSKPDQTMVREAIKRSWEAVGEDYWHGRIAPRHRSRQRCTSIFEESWRHMKAKARCDLAWLSSPSPARGEGQRLELDGLAFAGRIWPFVV